ncbi:Transcription elongation factor Spt4 [Candidatus Burarchaeum australiense]|nr:Transcription elongation factor Spt4 [Candidatus Burarchaeum australiense]
MTEKACRACHLIISEGNVCPNCHSTELSERWDSYVLIFDPEKSEVGKKLNAKVAGKYAVRIR